MSPEKVLMFFIVKSNIESNWIPDCKTDVGVLLKEAVNAVSEKSSIVTSVISVPLGLLPVGKVTNGGLSGIIVFSSITSNILDLYLGTVTSSVFNLLVIVSNFFIVTVLSGISTVPPCISALNIATLDFNLNLGSSFEANIVDNPRLFIIAGKLPLNPVLYLYSSLNLLRSWNVSDTSFGNDSFSKLPDSISIILPFKSDRDIPSTVAVTIDSLKGAKIVLAWTTSWWSVVGFLKNLIGWVFIAVDKSTFKVSWYLTLYAFWNSEGTSTASGLSSPNIVNVAKPGTFIGGE